MRKEPLDATARSAGQRRRWSDLPSRGLGTSVQPCSTEPDPQQNDRVRNAHRSPPCQRRHIAYRLRESVHRQNRQTPASASSARRAAVTAAAPRLSVTLGAVHVDAGVSGSLSIGDRPVPMEAVGVFLTFIYTKTGKIRCVGGTPEIQAVLAALPRTHHHVFTNPRTGATYTRTGMSATLRRARLRAGIVSPGARSICCGMRWRPAWSPATSTSRRWRRFSGTVAHAARAVCARV